MEAWTQDSFSEVGLPTEWPQDNISISSQFVVRGLHIQRRNPQGKLVHCIQGAILDMCLDLRRDSPTFLGTHMERLEPGRSLYCPPGTAHGFLALEDRSIVYYKCSTLYDRETDGGVDFLDPDLDSHWPRTWNQMYSLIRSDKDKGLPSVREWLADRRGVYEQR